MKKIISIILIAIIVSQIIGCYSTRELSLNDLRNLNDKEVIKIVMHDSKEFLLQHSPTSYYRSEWKMDEKYIHLYKTSLLPMQNDQKIMKVDTSQIPLSSIKNISHEKLNIILTVLCFILTPIIYVSVLWLTVLK
jgi:hypothetical protein